MSEQLDGFGHMSCDNLCYVLSTYNPHLAVFTHPDPSAEVARGRFKEAQGRFMEARGQFKETPVEADVTLLESTLILEIRQVRHKLRQNRQTFAIIRLEAIARADKPDQGHSGN